MTIERFSKTEFEAVLTGYDFTCDGLVSGEYTYTINVTPKVKMVLRSSVDSSGYAAATGEDSIRLSLVFNGRGLAKMDAWTNRTKGWQGRLEEKLATLYDRGKSLLDCPDCGGILILRDGRNGLFWGCANYPHCKHTQNYVKARPAVVTPPQTQQQAQPKEVSIPQPPVAKPKIRLNTQQRAYVEAPLDANIRVMAGAGSGKTASTIERIVYLIENGIDPQNIVYCVYNEAMAAEGFSRIVARIPEVENTPLRTQICTFHALFKRMLAAEGDRRDVAAEWEIKRCLQQIIEGDEQKSITGEWEGDAEKPGYKEVVYWIENAKYNALPTNEDYAFFKKHLGPQHGQKVHNARRRFDAEMLAAKKFTYADMLFDAEQRLMRDSAFRNRWQARYTHILIDEGQDTNSQALRMLITLSLNPGENPIYGGL